MKIPHCDSKWLNVHEPLAWVSFWGQVHRLTLPKGVYSFRYMYFLLPMPIPNLLMHTSIFICGKSASFEHFFLRVIVFWTSMEPLHCWLELKAIDVNETRDISDHFIWQTTSHGNHVFGIMDMTLLFCNIPSGSVLSLNLISYLKTWSEVHFETILNFSV